MAVHNPSLIPTEEVTAKRAFTAEEKRKMVEAPGNVAAHRIVFFRRTTQLVTFGLFVVFFFMTTVNSQNVGWVPKNLFMSLDFLNTLKNAIASHHVAVAALGPGVAGMRLTDRLPYFTSGVGYPDCLLLGLEDGKLTPKAAGFFGTDWGIKTGEFVWSK